MATLEEILAAIRNKELPRNNLTVNAAIGDYLGRQRERKKAIAASRGADITPDEQALASGNPTEAEGYAQYIGTQLGLTNPAANPIRPLGNNTYTAAPRASFVPQRPGAPQPPTPAPQMSLRDFISNPAAVKVGEAQLKRKQELEDYKAKQIIYRNLATQGAIDVATFKDEISNNKGQVVPWEKLTLNQKMRFAQVFKSNDLSGTTPDEKTLKAAYMASFGGDIPANQAEQSKEADLSPEAQEVLKRRKKSK